MFGEMLILLPKTALSDEKNNLRRFSDLFIVPLSLTEKKNQENVLLLHANSR